MGVQTVILCLQASRGQARDHKKTSTGRKSNVVNEGYFHGWTRQGTDGFLGHTRCRGGRLAVERDIGALILMGV